MASLNDFLVEDRIGLLIYDMNRLNKVPIEEFAKMRLEEMESFMKNHGKSPACYSCSKPIESADNLVRYFGRNDHNDCFLREYENDIFDFTAYQKEYFGLVKKSIEANNASGR